MGEPIARRLVAAGHEVAVYNRSPGKAERLVEQGAVVASSPHALWDHADVAITMVADDAALREVTVGKDGLLAEPPGSGTLVDMSTVSVTVSVEAAQAAEKGGVKYLRAPVSGNPSVVE